MICRIRAKNPEATILAEAIVGTDGVASLEGNWYFNLENVNLDALIETERPYMCPYKGRGYWYDLQLPDRLVKNVAWRYPDPMAGYEFIAERIAFYARETSGTLPEEVDVATIS